MTFIDDVILITRLDLCKNLLIASGTPCNQTRSVLSSERKIWLLLPDALCNRTLYKQDKTNKIKYVRFLILCGKITPAGQN